VKSRLCIARSTATSEGCGSISRFDDGLELYRNPRAVGDPATAEHFNHGGKGGPFYQMLKQMMLSSKANSMPTFAAS